MIEEPIAKCSILFEIKESGSDIYIEPKEDSLRVRYRIDAILHHKTDLPLETSQLMEDFIAFIIFTAERVERSLKSPFVDFSLRGKDGKIVMELETFVPKQLKGGTGTFFQFT